MRVSTLRDSAGVMSVITFDDLTDLLRAQKAETWQDVARKIAHEVKNPLTPIKLSAERLRKKFSDGSADFDRVFDESSRTIVQQVDGLKVLLDEFSEFARMPRPNPVPQGLQPVVDSVIQLYAGAHKDITVVKDIPAGLPDLLLDQEQMKRVFINLFKNAVEVMEAGGTIWISARKVPSDAMVRIEVADNGPGISAEDVSRLFEPYFSRKKKGGGLGLAIVERIIADHNGSVHAEPNQPHGARFIIDLPSGTAQRA
jgi:two-component system nitrogen regulation sensor histidine kinase NtrY